MAAKKFRGGGWRSGARVEQDDIHFPPRERLVNNRQITEDERQKSKSESAFDYRKHSLKCRMGRDIPQTQREECRATQISTGAEERMRGIGARVTVVHQAETKDQKRGPKNKKKQQGKGTVVAKKAFALL